TQRADTETSGPSPSRRRISAAGIVGWILTLLLGALLAMGAVMNLSGSQQALDGLLQYGYPESAMKPIGWLLLAVLVLYLIPQTAFLGAILLTGYLGGAVATHVRAADPIAIILTPAIVGVVVWIALYLREPRLRALAPFRRLI